MNEVKFQEYKSKLNCPDSCNDSSFDSGIIYNILCIVCKWLLQMKNLCKRLKSQHVSTIWLVVKILLLLCSNTHIPTAEDAIIQPMSCSFDDEEEIFRVPQKQRVAMKRKSTYRKYCKVPGPMYVYTCNHYMCIKMLLHLCSGLPPGVTFFRNYLLSIEVHI